MWVRDKISPWTVFKFVVSTLMILPIAGAMVFAFWGWGLAHPFAIFGAIAVLAFVLSVAQAIRHRKCRRYVAVSPMGIKLYDEGKCQWILWPDFIEARHTWHGTFIRYRRRVLGDRYRGFPIARSLRGVFDNAASAGEFCRLANVRKVEIDRAPRDIAVDDRATHL